MCYRHAFQIETEEEQQTLQCRVQNFVCHLRRATGQCYRRMHPFVREQWARVSRQRMSTTGSSTGIASTDYTLKAVSKPVKSSCRCLINYVALLIAGIIWTAVRDQTTKHASGLSMGGVEQAIEKAARQIRPGPHLFAAQGHVLCYWALFALR